jgi:multiple sugar transport system permease protein
MGFLEEVSSLSKSRVKRKKLTKLERYEARLGFAFISPWLIGFLLFFLVPMLASFYFSTLDFQLSAPDEAQFIGLDNWRRLLAEDPVVWQSLGVTFLFTLIALPIGIVFPVLLALLLNSKNLFGTNIFRTLFYAPTMVPAIAGVLIWQQVLNPQTGWLNRMIEWLSFGTVKAVGLEGLRWLDEPRLVYPALVFIGLWGLGNAMLTSLASLQGVPTELYEASEIDGAGYFRRLINITMPMISPIIFYNLLLGLVGLMQYFLIPFVLNGGSGYPENTTRFYMIYFYKQAFSFANMGYGATLAWFMFFIALFFTLILFGTARFWVYYPTGRD